MSYLFVFLMGLGAGVVAAVVAFYLAGGVIRLTDSKWVEFALLLLKNRTVLYNPPELERGLKNIVREFGTDEEKDRLDQLEKGLKPEEPTS